MSDSDAEIRRLLLQSLESTRTYLAVLQDAVRDHAISIATIQGDLQATKEQMRAVKEQIEYLVVSVDGNPSHGIAGLRTQAVMCTERFKQISKDLSAISATTEESRRMVAAAIADIKMINRDQGILKSFLDSWWKWILMVTPIVVYIAEKLLAD